MHNFGMQLSYYYTSWCAVWFNGLIITRAYIDSTRRGHATSIVTAQSAEF